MDKIDVISYVGTGLFGLATAIGVISLATRAPYNISNVVEDVTVVRKDDSSAGLGLLAGFKGIAIAEQMDDTHAVTLQNNDEKFNIYNKRFFEKVKEGQRLQINYQKQFDGKTLVRRKILDYKPLSPRKPQ